MNGWLAPLLACGTGGDVQAGDDTATSSASWPSDSSEPRVAAFVASGVWREPPWVPETASPRERTSDVSPHGRVQVWGNEVLLCAQAEGNGEFGGTLHPAGAMVVEEMFDGADVPLGVAVMLALEGGDWVYHCDGPASSCLVSGEVPVWGVGLDTECGFCHGGLVFNAF